MGQPRVGEDGGAQGVRTGGPGLGRTGEPRAGEDGGTQGVRTGALTAGLPPGTPRSGQTAGGNGGGQVPLRHCIKGLCQPPAPFRDPNPIGLKVAVLCSVVSESFQPHGLQPVRLLCPWDSPGKNTGVGCHFLLQRNLLDPRI